MATETCRYCTCRINATFMHCQMLTSKLVSGDHQNRKLSHCDWYNGLSSMRDNKSYRSSRTQQNMKTVYKYVSNGTGQECTSVCVGGEGGEGVKSFECNYFYS